MATFTFKVDDEALSTSEHELTATQIMQLAGADPATHYLVQILGKGHANKSYQDDPNEVIHMHEHMEFITNFTGVVPVS
jgi:hypothetical protein